MLPACDKDQPEIKIQRCCAGSIEYPSLLHPSFCFSGTGQLRINCAFTSLDIVSLYFSALHVMYLHCFTHPSASLLPERERVNLELTWESMESKSRADIESPLQPISRKFDFLDCSRAIPSRVPIPRVRLLEGSSLQGADPSPSSFAYGGERGVLSWGLFTCLTLSPLIPRLDSPGCRSSQMCVITGRRERCPLLILLQL